MPKPALSKLYFAAVQQNANRKQVIINVALRVKNDHEYQMIYIKLVINTVCCTNVDYTRKKYINKITELN